MKIAVIMPVRNGGKYLAEALDSLARQTRPADEIILVDDGSTEPLALKLLASPPLGAKVLRQPPAGPSAARNRAFEASTADAILPLDSDDLLLPRCLEALEAVLLADPAAAFSHCAVDNFGAETYLDVPPRFNPYLQLDDNFLVVTALLRRSIFDQWGLRWPLERGYEDWSFWLSVAERGGRGALVEEPLFRYRRRRDSLTFADKRRHQELLQGLRIRHAALYARRAELKALHAPGLEVLWQGGAGTRPALQQSLTDFVVTDFDNSIARNLFATMRGRFLLPLAPAQLAMLAAHPHLLTQALRLLEQMPHVEVLSLADLLIVRSVRAARLEQIDQPALEALAQGTGLVVSIADLESGKGQPPKPTAWRLVRRGLEAILGKERVGRLLHPMAVALHKKPAPRQPLLGPSRRRELELLERVPIRLT